MVDMLRYVQHVTAQRRGIHLDDYQLPVNVKQIGSIGEGLRIYIEDYVFTFLQKYALAGGSSERIALLIGRHMVIDGSPVLFINGAVCDKYSIVQEGMTVFTVRSMEYAQEMIKKYFEGMEIVGWMQSQPSYGTFLNSAYANYHLSHFDKEYDVMFVIDPIEKVNAFFTYVKNGLRETKGYFIYYEKNKAMQEYMLENRPIEMEYPLKEPILQFEEPDEEDAEQEYPRHTPEQVIRTRQETRNVVRSVREQKRVMNLLVSLSAVLFVVCFVMGAGLIRNQDRVEYMEQQLVQLSTSYKNLVAETSKEKTASVFAPQDDKNVIESQETKKNTLTEPTPSPTPEPTPEATPEPTEEPTPEPHVEPTAPPPATAPPEPIYRTYVIQNGDSLNSISIRFYGDVSMVERIMVLNGIKDQNKIISGKEIKLP